MEDFLFSSSNNGINLFSSRPDCVKWDKDFGYVAVIAEESVTIRNLFNEDFSKTVILEEESPSFEELGLNDNKSTSYNQSKDPFVVHSFQFSRVIRSVKHISFSPLFHGKRKFISLVTSDGLIQLFEKGESGEWEKVFDVLDILKKHNFGFPSTDDVHLRNQHLSKYKRILPFLSADVRTKLLFNLTYESGNRRKISLEPFYGLTKLDDSDFELENPKRASTSITSPPPSSLTLPPPPPPSSSFVNTPTTNVKEERPIILPPPPPPSSSSSSSSTSTSITTRRINESMYDFPDGTKQVSMEHPINEIELHQMFVHFYNDFVPKIPEKVKERERNKPEKKKMVGVQSPNQIHIRRLFERPLEEI